ncbi:MAG TPA: SGNH/GDSL hydrolase family protein, partial [Elusimicrobiota bacterium]|nr:SGNH/GDSL hydrolase family protein [Elusimicrobiota bacterium]
MIRKFSTKGRILAVLAGFVVLAAAILPAELWARRKWPARQSAAESTNDFDYFHLQIHDDFFKLERKFGVIPWRYRTQRPRAGGVQYFDAYKKPGVTRVFVIGGSVAMGFNAQEMSRLGEFLRRSLPGRAFEIVGCGMGGYDSYRVGLVEEEVLRHEADLIIVLAGNNEFGSRAHFNPTLVRLNDVFRESRLFQVLQDSYRPRWKEAPWPLKERLE